MSAQVQCAGGCGRMADIAPGDSWLCEECAASRIATLERQLAEARAEMGALREALWGFDYPCGPRRDYFCAGCDMDGDEHLRGTRDDLHDPDCRAARAALAPEAGKELLARLESYRAALELIRRDKSPHIFVCAIQRLGGNVCDCAHAVADGTLSDD